MEPIPRIIFIGDCGTGKTFFIDRLCGRVTTDFHKPSKTDHTIITTGIIMDQPVALYDIVNDYPTGYMRDGSSGCAAFVFFDVTRLSTMENVVSWKKQLDEKYKDIPIILLANKSDLASNTVYEVGSLNMDKICEKYGFLTWFSTSAKEGTNVKEAFDKLISVFLTETRLGRPVELKKRVAQLEEERQKLLEEIDANEQALGIEGDEKLVNRWSRLGLL